MAHVKLISCCIKICLFFSRARRNFVPYLFFNSNLFIMAINAKTGVEHPEKLPGEFITEPDFGPLGKPLDDEIDVEGPSVIFLPQKNCYFNGFQTVDTLKGYNLDSRQAIVFRGTQAGMHTRNAVFELLRHQNELPIIAELIIDPITFKLNP